MKFKEDFGVYVCPHVFDESRPVLDSVRDFDGSWQFLCGVKGCLDDGEPKHVGVGHLVKSDSTINELTALAPGTYAERANPETKWSFGKLDKR